METWADGDEVQTEDDLLGPITSSAGVAIESKRKRSEEEEGEDGAGDAGAEDQDDQGSIDQEADGNLKLFIGGLPDDATSEHLEEHFSQFGLILQANVRYSEKNQRSLRYGFVTLSSVDGSHEEVLQSAHEILGKTVDVKRDDPGLRPKAAKSGGGSQPAGEKLPNKPRKRQRVRRR